MGRLSELPTRSEVDDNVEQHEKNMTEQLEALDIVTIDTEAVRDTIDALEISGTSDGADAVESAMDEAESVTVEIFDREDDNLEDMQNESEDCQSELQERSDTSLSDLGRISDASGRIETQETVSELSTAEAAVLEDIEFLNEEIEEENSARERAESEQQGLENRIHGGGR